MSVQPSQRSARVWGVAAQLSAGLLLGLSNQASAAADTGKAGSATFGEVRLSLGDLAQRTQTADRTLISDAAIVALIARDELTRARELFARTVPDDADWHFFDGRVAKAAGHLGQAEWAFREALRLKPSHLRAKRELAHTLFVAKDYDGAAHHFRALLKADPEAEYRRGYLRFLRAIDRLRPFSINGHFALVSSSNVNRGSSESEFVPGVPDVPRFDITSQAESAAGVEVGIAARYRLDAGEDRQLIFDAGVLGRKFDRDKYDNATFSARLRFGEFNEKTRWSIGPLVRATVSADGNDSVSVGFGANYERQVSRKLTAFVSGLHQHRFAFDEGASDAPFTTLQAGVVRPIRNGSVAVGSRLVRYRPDKEHQRYFGQAVFSRVSRSWSEGLAADFGLELGRRGYATDFPLAGEPREDLFYQLTFTVQHDRFRVGRFMPTVNCIIGGTDSNIAFFEHSVKECTFGVTTRL